MSDREVQDEIIRYITDPGARQNAKLGLTPQQAARAAQFGRFLARRYYRDRLGRSFRYSALLFADRRATDIVESSNFKNPIADGFLGSLAVAQRMGERAIAWLRDDNKPIWWNALLEYERAHFLQTATSEVRQPAAGVERGLSAMLLNFDCDLPEILRRIKTKQRVDDDLRRQVTLLFSRTRGGRIYVMEVDAQTAAVFEAVDGARGEQEIAMAAGLDLNAAQSILNSLVEIGAVIRAEAAREEFQPARVLGI